MEFNERNQCLRATSPHKQLAFLRSKCRGKNQQANGAPFACHWRNEDRSNATRNEWFLTCTNVYLSAQQGGCCEHIPLPHRQPACRGKCEKTHHEQTPCLLGTSRRCRQEGCRWSSAGSCDPVHEAQEEKQLVRFRHNAPRIAGTKTICASALAVRWHDRCGSRRTRKPFQMGSSACA